MDDGWARVWSEMTDSELEDALFRYPPDQTGALTDDANPSLLRSMHAAEF
jgi:hypothetical protein